MYGVPRDGGRLDGDATERGDLYHVSEVRKGTQRWVGGSMIAPIVTGPIFDHFGAAVKRAKVEVAAEQVRADMFWPLWTKKQRAEAIAKAASRVAG